MTVTKESKDALNAEIKILVSPEDYKPQVDQELKKQAKKANMPGFRPGKVPISIIRKYAGKQILLETLQNKVGQELQGYIEDEKLKLVGGPMLKTQLKEEELDTSCNSEVEFVFELGLEPELELNLKLKKAVPLYEVKLDDKYVEEELGNQRKRLGKFEEVESYETGDTVYGTLAEVVGEGEEGFSQMVALNPERVENAKLFKPFVGKKAEDTLPFDIFKVADDVQEIAKLTFIDKEELEQLEGKKLEFTIKKINRTEEADLDDTFFRAVLGAKYPEPESPAEEATGEENETPEEVEASQEATEDGESPAEEAQKPTITEDAFMELFKESLQESLEREGRNYFMSKTITGIQDANAIDLPDDFLKKWLLENNEQLNEDNIEEQYKGYQESLRYSILTNTIFDKNPDYDFDVEDVKTNIRERIKENVPGITPEQEESFVNNFLQNEEYLRMEMNRLSEQKMGDFLINHYSPSAKSITATKFFKMIEKEREEEEKKKK